MVHSAGCGFQGLDPLVCCPQHHESSLHNSRLIRFAPPRDRWVWDAPTSSKPNPGFNRFMAYATEMHLLDYRDFQAQRNCPQPLDDEDYDEHYFGHHFEYQIDHGEQPKSQTPRPTPKDRPIVFPGDLRFHKSIETKSAGELMAAASQEQVIREMGSSSKTMPPSITTPVLAARINSADCGISLTTRIQGGEQAQPGQYPWLARIAYRNKSKLTAHKILIIPSKNNCTQCMYYGVVGDGIAIRPGIIEKNKIKKRLILTQFIGHCDHFRGQVTANTEDQYGP